MVVSMSQLLLYLPPKIANRNCEPGYGSHKERGNWENLVGVGYYCVCGVGSLGSNCLVAYGTGGQEGVQEGGA